MTLNMRQLADLSVKKRSINDLQRLRLTAKRFRASAKAFEMRDALAKTAKRSRQGRPDPFGEEASFAAQNNRRLQRFLDSFGFDYEFKSSTETYQSGEFDEALVRMAETYEKVMGIMLPTLGDERKATYSPFLPISPVSGKVLQVPMLSVDASAGTITYREPETGDEITQPVTGGSCKVQWKPDWALRWYALQVDYEMYGKDLIDSAKIAARITSALGGPAPEGFSYELFLDEQGQKISKSKGNGLSIEEWLEYGPAESLSLYMFQRPRAAKKLHFDVIPKAVDDYVTFLEKFPGEAGREAAGKPRLAHPRAGPSSRRRRRGFLRHAAQPRLSGER